MVNIKIIKTLPDFYIKEDVYISFYIKCNPDVYRKIKAPITHACILKNDIQRAIAKGYHIDIDNGNLIFDDEYEANNIIDFKNKIYHCFDSLKEMNIWKLKNF